MDKIEYFMIDTDSEFYNEAVKLRYRVFFESSHSSMDAIYDEIENKSFHIVAVRNNCVLGYIRLTEQGGNGLVSQFVVEENARGTALIGKKLIDMVEQKAREDNLSCLYGEIRLHVEKAAKIYGFEVYDEIVYSKKTGIPHKRIYKSLSEKDK